MPTAKIKRKLTTILCADVQGYTGLMGIDEAGTLERLNRYRGIMAELFERHDGRKVNTWGDAVIAEFPSVVEAVRCAVEIQDAIGAENRDLPSDRQMRFRIGINLGDVMQDGSDLYGDGVNVASRLESLSDPGGIMVSETVYDLTHRQLSFSYDYAGEQTVKGQEQPIAGYRVRMADDNGPPVSSVPGLSETLLDPAPAYKPPQRAPKPERPVEQVQTNVPVASQEGSVSEHRDGRGLSRLATWYLAQPRSVRLPVAMIGLLFMINLLTNGLNPAWFVYPSAVFAVMIVVRLLAGPIWKGNR